MNSSTPKTVIIIEDGKIFGIVSTHDSECLILNRDIDGSAISVNTHLPGFVSEDERVEYRFERPECDPEWVKKTFGRFHKADFRVWQTMRPSKLQQEEDFPVTSDLESLVNENYKVMCEKADEEHFDLPDDRAYE